MPTQATKQTQPVSASNFAGSDSGLDPRTLLSIKNLELRARIVVEGFMAGLHRSPYHGFSVEFTDYRQYTPGDDPRYLDWKLLARTDRMFIKRFEDETNLRCTLVVDQSRSMGYGSVGHSKIDYAKTLAAALAFFLARQRDATGLLTFDEGVSEYIPARYRPGHLRRLMVGLERTVSGSTTDVNTALERVANIVSKRGMVVLISDLLTPIDTLHKQLGYLHSRGHDVVILRILDPAETEFNFQNEALFEDSESLKQLYIDPQSTRAEYLKRFDEHAAQLKQICDDQVIELHTLSTVQPLEKALLDFVASRSRKTNQLGRRQSQRNRSEQNRRVQPAGEVSPS